jgi:hypothetical protein
MVLSSLIYLVFFLSKIFYSLQAYSRVKGARYLLVGSYLGIGNNKTKNNTTTRRSSQNRNIKVGDAFSIDLTSAPFNLSEYVHVYSETGRDPDPKTKSLILYDIPNYLSRVDFDRMKIRLRIK